MLIGRELEDRGIITPAAIGAALGMPAAEATKLLTRHQWREDDVAALEEVAARLGVHVPYQTRGTSRPVLIIRPPIQAMVSGGFRARPAALDHGRSQTRTRAN